MSELGYSTVGGSTSAFIPGYIYASGPWTAPASGTLTGLKVYLGVAPYDSGLDLTAAVYNDEGGFTGATLVAAGASTNVPDGTDGWVTLPLSGAIVEGQEYWFAVQASEGEGTYAFDSGTPYWNYIAEATYDTWPGTIGGASQGGTAVLSIYATYTSGGGPPVNTVAPAVTGTAEQNQTLTCTTGTFTGDVSSGYAYQWQRDFYLDGNYSNIPGATASTYVCTVDDVNCDVRCVVTATGTGGSTAADSNTVTPIACETVTAAGGFFLGFM